MSSSSSFSTTTTTNRSGRAEQWWWLWDNRAPLRRPSQRCCGGAGLRSWWSSQWSATVLLSYKLANIYIGSLDVGHWIETDISRILNIKFWKVLVGTFQTCSKLQHHCIFAGHLCASNYGPNCTSVVTFVNLLSFCASARQWVFWNGHNAPSNHNLTLIHCNYSTLSRINLDGPRAHITIQSKRGVTWVGVRITIHYDTLRYITIQSIRGGCMGHNRSNGLWKEV